MGSNDLNLFSGAGNSLRIDLCVHGSLKGGTTDVSPERRDKEGWGDKEGSSIQGLTVRGINIL